MIAGLLDHLWQSTVFLLLVAAIQTLLRKNAARHRYWLWLAASLKFLIPFSLLLALGAEFAPAAPPAALGPDTLQAIQGVAHPFAEVEAASDTPVATPWLAIALAAWALGCTAVLSMWARRWSKIASAVRAATPVKVEAPLPVLASPHAMEPGLVGIWRPVLLLPEGITAKLSKAQMRAVVAHEVCHLRRGDNLAALAHMVVESLFWFHPLVWWLGARLVDERERACDEAVLESGGDPKAYAEGILKVCKHYVQSPLACAGGISGANLRQRIERIITVDVGARLPLAKKVALSLMGAFLVVAPVWLGWVSAVPAAALHASPDQDFARLLADQQRPRRAVAYNAASFDRYVGYYQLAPQLVLAVSRDGGRFMAKLTGRNPVEIVPESGSKFFALDDAQQISFTTDRQGATTGLILHQYGYEQRAPRILRPGGAAAEAALASRIERNAPSPGTEASLRRYISSVQQGRPNYEEMSPVWAARVRATAPQLQARLRQWGALQQIAFRGVTSGGQDIYDATFEKAKIQWLVAPLTADAKIQGRWYTELPRG